jgi:squalene synthase HpnC
VTPEAASLGRPPASLPSLAEVSAKAPAENFGVAPLLLPRRVRRHLLAVYAFARLVDDVGDEVDGNRAALLDWIEEDLERAFAGRAEHPVLQRLSPSLREPGLSREQLLRLIEANRCDQRVSRYATYDELAEYCSLSANPVGRLVLELLGASTPARIQSSDAVCTALQLAEHWQDVGEDYRRGRVYLPLQDLADFEVAEVDLGRAEPTPAFRRLMDFEVVRARGLLAEGLPLVRSLSGRARMLVAGFVAGGRAALDAVEHSGYDVLSSEPRATSSAKRRALLRVLREARR